MAVAIHTTMVQASAEQLFSVYEQPQNISAVTGVPVQVLNAEMPVRVGSIQTFAVGPRWLRMRWEAVIERYIPPLLLVDVQRRGPFRRFRHAHCVLPLGEDCSVAVDIIDYEWRTGRAGRLVERFILKPLIVLLLRDRYRRLASFLRRAPPSACEAGDYRPSRSLPEEVAP